MPEETPENAFYLNAFFCSQYVLILDAPFYQR